MTNEDYKNAQERLGYYGRNKLQAWLELLCISESSHAKYRSGHLKIPMHVEKIISLIEARDCLLSFISFVVEEKPDEVETFMRLWYEGDFDAIRKEWDNVPEAIFSGAEIKS